MNDIKIKGLRPTMRVKKRFLRIRVISSTQFDFKTLSYAINNYLLKQLGVYEFGNVGVWIIREKFNQQDQELVLKVSVQGVEKVRAFLALPFSIEKHTVHCECQRVSGTLKGVLEK
ncbi:MAG: Rpp14/Pop5 family protein [Candidatus Nanoarchaeia archaeon]